MAGNGSSIAASCYLDRTLITNKQQQQGRSCKCSQSIDAVRRGVVSVQAIRGSGLNRCWAFYILLLLIIVHQIKLAPAHFIVISTVVLSSFSKFKFSILIPRIQLRGAAGRRTTMPQREERSSSDTNNNDEMITLSNE